MDNQRTDPRCFRQTAERPGRTNGQLENIYSSQCSEVWQKNTVKKSDGQIRTPEYRFKPSTDQSANIENGIIGMFQYSFRWFWLKINWYVLSRRSAFLKYFPYNLQSSWVIAWLNLILKLEGESAWRTDWIQLRSVLETFEHACIPLCIYIKKKDLIDLCVPWYKENSIDLTEEQNSSERAELGNSLRSYKMNIL